MHQLILKSRLKKDAFTTTTAATITTSTGMEKINSLLIGTVNLSTFTITQLGLLAPIPFESSK